MLVAVTGLGRVWRHRFGKDTDDASRFARAVYYNTTGVVVEGKIRQRPQICGYARFDAVGGFNASVPSRMISRVFECAEPSVWMGYNKLLFRRMLTKGERPDCFLVAVRQELTGVLAVGTSEWRSSDTWLLSFSACAQEQEGLFLMPAYGWIRAEVGRFVLEPSERRPWMARLVLSCSE
jgi:hypothetical protein